MQALLGGQRQTELEQPPIEEWVAVVEPVARRLDAEQLRLVSEAEFAARPLLNRDETRVFEANGPHGIRFTLTEPWTLLMLDDAKVIHESTPILPTAPDGHRDTLVLTFRSAGFQGPSAEALVPAATAPN